MANTLTADLRALAFAMDGLASCVVERFDLDHSRFVFLSPLLAGPLDVTRLAGSLNYSKAAVSKRLAGLAAEGLIQTEEERSTGRRVVISLTADGRRRVGGAAAELNRRFASLLDRLEIDVTACGDQVRAVHAGVAAALAAEGQS